MTQFGGSMCARRVLIALVLWAISFPILSRADDLICFGVRNSWKVEKETTSCGAGFNGPIYESVFRSKCFTKEGSWTGSHRDCGGQSEAPKKYSYSQRSKEIERENKKIAKAKQNEEQAPSGSPGAGTGKNVDNKTTQNDTQDTGGKSGTVGNSTVMSKDDAAAHRKDMDHRKDLGRQDLALEKRIETHGKDLKEDRQSLKQENAKLKDLTKERDALAKELENNNNPDLAARKEKLDKAVADQTDKVDGIKQEVTKDRKDLKAAKKEDRRLEKQQEGAADIEDIKVQKEDRAYGGLFGGSAVDTTVTINQTSDKVSKVSETGSANRVQMAGEDRAAALRLNGTTKVNVDSVNQAVQDSTKDAKAALRTSGMIDMALGMFQAFRGEEHVRSIKKVDETAETANKDVQTIHAEEMRRAEELENRAKTETASSQTLIQEATTIRNNANENRDSTLGIVQNNQNEENDKQSNAAMIQGMEAGARIMGAAEKFRQAAALQAVQAQMGGNSKQFGFGMNNGIQQTGGQDPTLVPQAQQAAVEQEAEKKAQELDQRPPLNLGDNNLAQDGPPAAAFIPTDVRPEGAGGGGGMGAAGGTSADKSAMEAGNQGPAAKTSAGTYAAVAGGGYKAKNSGSGGKAGVDSGFADLLKKFLPGAEKEQAKNGPGELQFGDRSPASSQAAVIGRNKNIFEEIHKRYQKKSAEGAIMF